MLNKELLLMGSGESVPYTHIIHVGQASDREDYGYSSSPQTYKFGELFPNTVEVNGTEVVVQNLLTYYWSNNIYVVFHLDVYSPDKDLYLGRADTKEFVLYYGSNLDLGYIEYSSAYHGRLDIRFSKDDVGKDIPLWISTEQPPPIYTPVEVPVTNQNILLKGL